MSTAVSASPRLLRRALAGNGLFSLSSGLVSLLWAEPLAGSPGIPSVPVLRIVGLVLMGYAGFLFWLASAPTGPTRLWRMAFLASALDGGWVIGSGVLLALPGTPWTVLGRWVIGGLAVIVAGWGLLQVIGLTRPLAVEA
jgi:hypothetical protein